MLGIEQVRDFAGKDVYGSDGAKIGSASDIYLDDKTGQPEWVTVRTGLFGTKQSFIPLADADVSGDRLTVPYAKDLVKDAPKIDEDGRLSEEQERELYSYYNRTDYDVGDSDVRGHETSGRANDDAMTVSEERLRVGTQEQEAGRARLRKYVVTENVTQTVPVQREEVRLEREPITDANRDDALSGSDIAEDTHEVVLTEERPVVAKETVPVERVRLETDTVTEHETVGDEIRKERVEVDGDVRGDERPRTSR